MLTEFKTSFGTVFRPVVILFAGFRMRFLIMAVAGPLLVASCSGPMNVTEKMMWSTYPMATQRGAATAFIVNHRDPEAPGGVVPVVFTSVHVLDTIGDGPLMIGFRKPKASGGTEVALLAFMPPKSSGKERFYVRHPKHDIAAFLLRVPAELTGAADLRTAMTERQLVRAGRSLKSGVEVSFLGYPDVYPGTEGAFPILRSGRVASYPVATPQAYGRFFINADVYPGDSGAPVFIASGGSSPELVGMITKRVGPNAHSFSHLALAVDVQTIRETLALLLASEKRRSGPDKR